MKTSPAFASSRSCRGSVLMVALLISGSIAIFLGSYFSLCMNTYKASNRSYHMTSAMNVAEAGLEQALWSINQLKVMKNGNAFDGWTVSGNDAKKAYGGLTMGQNRDGVAQVLVKNYNGTLGAPRVTSRAILTLGDGTTVEKWVEVTLSKRSRFTTGLVAKDKVVFSGTNASVDSWNSDPDMDSSTPAIPYSAGVRKDGGSVGSVSVEVGVVSVQNADIWGTVSTGAVDPTNSVLKNGSVLGADSAAKDKSTWLKSNVDKDRVSMDFTASLDVERAPTNSTMTLGAVTETISLPRVGDTADPDGRYYYRTYNVALINKQINVTSSEVVIIVPSGYSVDIGGGDGAINISTGASLAIYAGGDVKIAGNGIANGTPATSGGSLTTTTVQQPVKFQIWGTAEDTDNNPTTTHQSIDVKGNGVFSGIIYAPNAELKVNGNGDVVGAAIANKVTLTGNAAFHFDESLKNFDAGSPYGIALWRELLSQSDKTALAAEF